MVAKRSDAQCRQGILVVEQSRLRGKLALKRMANTYVHLPGELRKVAGIELANNFKVSDDTTGATLKDVLVVADDQGIAQALVHHVAALLDRLVGIEDYMVRVNRAQFGQLAWLEIGIALMPIQNVQLSAIKRYIAQLVAIAPLTGVGNQFPPRIVERNLGVHGQLHAVQQFDG